MTSVIEMGCGMGYEGKELQEFVREQQMLDRKERERERE